MGIQNSINSLLGTAATIAEVANISKEVKAGNALTMQNIASDLQQKELDVHGALLQDKIGVINTKDEIRKLKQGLKDIRASRASGEPLTPERHEQLKRETKDIGFNIMIGKEAMRNLEGQIAGKRAQLNDIRARMQQMNVKSLLPEKPEGGNE